MLKVSILREFPPWSVSLPTTPPKQFKVTDTQIFRIKRGENWAEIEAAK
jgi:hypothetical protein